MNDSEQEPLARYLFSRSHYSPKYGKVKPGAFLPRDGATSVFNVAGLSSVEEIWEIATEFVGRRGNRNLHGHAEIDSGAVLEAGLSLEVDNDPPRHANIVDWPEEKAERKARALKLASAAILWLRNDAAKE
jgi:hypothetical protein